ncbi:MAG: lytic murein transglycosylase [Sphaerotilus natans]
MPDALASTANFPDPRRLEGRTAWGFEVRLPASFSTEGQGRRVRQPMARWRELDLRRADARRCRNSSNPPA